MFRKFFQIFLIQHSSNTFIIKFPYSNKELETSHEKVHQNILDILPCVEKQDCLDIKNKEIIEKISAMKNNSSLLFELLDKMIEKKKIENISKESTWNI